MAHKNGNGTRLPNLNDRPLSEMKLSTLLSPQDIKSNLYHRYKRRVATLYQLGTSIAEIASQIGMTRSTIRRWLEKEELQELINAYDQEFHHLTERRYAKLFERSVKRMEGIVDRAESDVALDAIKTIWKARGVLVEKQSELNIINQARAEANAQANGSPIESRDQAQVALQWLRAQRRSVNIEPKQVEE